MTAQPGPDRFVVDAEDMITALQNHDLETEYFFDRLTGEIALICDEGITGKDEDLRELIEQTPDRFLFIEGIAPSVGYRIMEDFIERLPPGKAAQRLKATIQRRKPFRHFKDELLSFPDVRQDWFAFEYREMLGLARAWLESEGIDADLKTRQTAG